jgi:uncharacterized protein involved in tolerance to divalent cations
MHLRAIFLLDNKINDCLRKVEILEDRLQYEEEIFNRTEIRTLLKENKTIIKELQNSINQLEK